MRKTRILSLILAVVMVATMAPLALPVFADVTVATPGENAYLDVNFSKGTANTEVVNKALLLSRINGANDPSDPVGAAFMGGIKFTGSYMIDATKTYEIKVDAKAVDPNDVGGIRANGPSSSVKDGNLGRGSRGIKFGDTTYAIPVAGAEAGWYTYTFKYEPTADHLFSLTINNGFDAIYTLKSLSPVIYDNIILYEDGVPVLTYDFGTDDQFADWTFTDNGYGSDPYFVSGSVEPYYRTERPAVVDTTFDYYYALTEREHFWAGVTLDPDLAVTAGETYIVKFDVKAEDVNEGLRAYANVPGQNLVYGGIRTEYGVPGTGNASVKFNAGTPVTGRDGWYTHEIKYEVVSDHNFKLNLPGGHTVCDHFAPFDDFYLDNVLIYKEGVAEPIINYTFTPNTDYSGLSFWADNDGNYADPGSSDAVGTVVTPPTPVTDCGAGVAINTGITAEVGKTYTLEFALKTNLDGATFFAQAYTGTTLEAGIADKAITAGTAAAEADGWYVHTIPFVAASADVINFEILGGEDFAFINNLVDNGKDIFIDSIALYENGVSDALWTANYSSYAEVADAVVYNETNDKVNVKLTYDPTKFIKEESKSGASGILALLLLRRKAAQGGETPVEPEAPVVDTNGYISIKNRGTFWTGAVLESFAEVEEGKTYTVTFEAKSEDPTDDFRMSPVAGDVTTDPNLGTSAGVLFTAGTPVEGKDGWYAFSFPYIPTQDHTFQIRIFGGYNAKGVDLAVGVSNADFHLDNFCLYEDGVDEPVLKYDFDTVEYIEDWNSFVIYTPDVSAPDFVHYMPPKPVDPNAEVTPFGGYMAVSERATFWSGLKLETFVDVEEGKKYTITFDAKSDGIGDDFRMSTPHGLVTDNNLGTAAGKRFTAGTPVEGRDGWYSFSLMYVPTEDHTFAITFFGGYEAKGVELPNVSKGDFYLDNFCVYEEGVDEPIIEYNFNTEEYFEDWSGVVVINENGYADPKVELVLPDAE